MLKALPREDFANNVTLLFPTPDIWSDTLYHLNQSQRAGLQAFPPQVADAFLPYLMPGTYATVRTGESVWDAGSRNASVHTPCNVCRGSQQPEAVQVYRHACTTSFGYKLQWAALLRMQRRCWKWRVAVLQSHHHGNILHTCIIRRRWNWRRRAPWSPLLAPT